MLRIKDSLSLFCLLCSLLLAFGRVKRPSIPPDQCSTYCFSKRHSLNLFLFRWAKGFTSSTVIVFSSLYSVNLFTRQKKKYLC
uniref:Secreted protein n=1 Tax=Pygocentrus nattereri TaxID=42514 RepID=A0A3B4DW03_PYGNA